MTAFLSAAMAVALAQLPAEVQKDFSIDLLLVGNNGPAISSWDWIDKPGQDSPIQSLLREEIDRLQQGNCKYLIVDGGDSSVFVPKTGNRQIQYFFRISTYAPTLTESWVSHGVTHVKKSNWARLNTGQSGGYSTTYGMPIGYSSQLWLYVDNVTDHQCLEFNDMTTIRTLRRDNPKEIAPADERVIISERSIADTIQDLGADEAAKGIALCEWGFPDPAYPNVVAYPPAGVVSHYKLTRTNGRLGLTFVEYLGSPSLSY